MSLANENTLVLDDANTRNTLLLVVADNKRRAMSLLRRAPLCTVRVVACAFAFLCGVILNTSTGFLFSALPEQERSCDYSVFCCPNYY